MPIQFYFEKCPQWETWDQEILMQLQNQNTRFHLIVNNFFPQIGDLSNVKKSRKKKFLKNQKFQPVWDQNQILVRQEKNFSESN